jgi:hypothetical protein
MITELLTRLRFLVFRKKRSELDDELRFHLEQSIATKVAAGLPVSEARRLALVEFGGVEVTRERCERQRPGWWVGTIAKDLRYSLRGIVVHRWFSAAIIVTLALGIGLNSMVFILSQRSAVQAGARAWRRPPYLHQQPQFFADRPQFAYLVSRFPGLPSPGHVV